MLELFRDRVIERDGIEVYQRMEEQMNSDDTTSSDCAGLVAYVLGLIDENQLLGTLEFKARYIWTQPQALVAIGDQEGNVSEDPSSANVCMYGSPVCPVHYAIYLGVMGDGIFIFDKLIGEKPKVRTAVIEWLTLSEHEAIFNPTIRLPDVYYKLNHNGSE